MIFKKANIIEHVALQTNTSPEDKTFQDLVKDALEIMKRFRTSILLSCVLLSGCTKESVEMDVLSSHSATSSNWYELNINVIADKDTILDRDACSNEIIQHVLDNDFHSIRFSYDLSGYPNEVTVDVFTSEKNFKKGKVAYSFDYVTDFNTENVDIQNNIKDNSDEFEIQYK